MGTYATKAIWIALGANVVIFLIKTVAAMISGSAAMFSESLHSLADTVNSILLLTGMRLARQPPDDVHPFGYGKEVYFWSLMASMFMLGVTSMGSIYRGYIQLLEKQPLSDTSTSLIVLSLAVVFEVFAAYNAMRAVVNDVGISAKGLKAITSSFKSFRQVTNPAVKFIFFEDLASLTGALLAFAAIVAADITGLIAIDAYVSIVIGGMLAVLAILLGHENRELIVGKSASESIENHIGNVTLAVPGVKDIHELKTMFLGPSDLLINMEVEVSPELTVEKVDDVVAEIEEVLRKKIPISKQFSIEVLADDRKKSWNPKEENVL